MSYFLIAAEEQLGSYALHMMLHQAGLERYIADPPARNRRAEVLSQEYSGLQKELRVYYGKNARGSLNRIGHSIFQSSMKDASLIRRIGFLWARLLPPPVRQRKCLELLARELGDCSGQASVHSDDHDFMFIVHDNRLAYGQNSAEPICWVIQGMIQETLLWATGVEVDVREVACQAAGERACTFRILLNETL